MTLPSYAVYFRGHPCCPCQIPWTTALEAEAQRRGILDGPLPVSQMIGGAPQSGGTHLTGGAEDIYPLSAIKDVNAFVRLCRALGADATWHRPENWDHAGGVEHVHIVLRGCPHNSAARYQYDSTYVGVDRGHNGLASGALDDGPKPLSHRTWRQGIAWAKQQEDDMPYTEKQLTDIVRAGVAAELDPLKTALKNRDQRLRDLVKRKFEATDADLNEIFGAVGALED